MGLALPTGGNLQQFIKQIRSRIDQFRKGGFLPITGTSTRRLAHAGPSRAIPTRMSAPSPAPAGRVMPRPEKYDFTYAGRSNVRVGMVKEKYDFTY